jgi:hypothetical protein
MKKTCDVYLGSIRGEWSKKKMEETNENKKMASL